jgi:hypothetical protein
MADKLKLIQRVVMTTVNIYILQELQQKKFHVWWASIRQLLLFNQSINQSIMAVSLRCRLHMVKFTSTIKEREGLQQNKTSCSLTWSCVSLWKSVRTAGMFLLHFYFKRNGQHSQDYVFSKLDLLRHFYFHFISCYLVHYIQDSRYLTDTRSTDVHANYLKVLGLQLQ